MPRTKKETGGAVEPLVPILISAEVKEPGKFHPPDRAMHDRALEFVFTVGDVRRASVYAQREGIHTGIAQVVSIHYDS